MKILMLGWELPPLASGGLGTACNGLLRALRHEGEDVVFVMPWAVQDLGQHKHYGKGSINVIGVLGSVRIGEVTESSMINPLQFCISGYGASLYGDNILDEVNRFGEAVIQTGQQDTFDVIHAHDWMTYRAGILAMQALGKPLVVHVHSTEHDRTPGTPSPQICALEKEGLIAADQVITVSRYTKQQVIKNYGVCPRKVKVIHNGIDKDIHLLSPAIMENVAMKQSCSHRTKIVLFVGRLTVQKGPQYFLLAAKRVLEFAPELHFLIVGDGDMRYYLERMVNDLGIADNVRFLGFLSQFDLSRIYTLASVCVMTSVSEPFGLVALEAMQHGVPVIIPRHAGVTEVVKCCLRVDYWDIDSIAEGILTMVNNRDSLAEELSNGATQEVARLTWEKAAKKLIGIYHELSD